jgi:hypothetical protein
MDSHDKKDMLSSLTLLCSFGPEKQFMKRTLGGMDSSKFIILLK